MRKLTFFLLVILSLTSLFGCSEELPPRAVLTSVCRELKIDGTVYSTDSEEGEGGYLSDNLREKMFIFPYDVRVDFAVLPSSRPDSRAECAVFLAKGDSERIAVFEACRERIRLLGVSDCAVVVKHGKLIFYSTFPDSDRATSAFFKAVRN